jgi:hypothetical protein
MAPMTRILAPLLTLAFASSLTACTSDPEKQWYKPSGNYTTAEFERDSKACTKKSVLDEECLKQRGWVPLSGDIARKPGEKPSAGGANKESNRY